MYLPLFSLPATKTQPLVYLKYIFTYIHPSHHTKATEKPQKSTPLPTKPSFTPPTSPRSSHFPPNPAQYTRPSGHPAPRTLASHLQKQPPSARFPRHQGTRPTHHAAYRPMHKASHRVFPIHSSPSHCDHSDCPLLLSRCVASAEASAFSNSSCRVLAWTSGLGLRACWGVRMRVIRQREAAWRMGW